MGLDNCSHIRMYEKHCDRERGERTRGGGGERDDGGGGGGGVCRSSTTLICFPK